VFCSASELAKFIRNGTVSATIVLKAFPAQISAHNPALKAIVALAEEGARRRAWRDYLRAAVESTTADYGSIDNYIHGGLGLSAGARRRFQDALLI
jgi:Asp-tRNA(Asn)/Glu-tRNA(Gln) amidotransferase A subunit family amidase